MTYIATQIDPEDNDTFIITKAVQAASATGKSVPYNSSIVVSLSKRQQGLTMLQNQLKQLQAQIIDIQAQLDAINAVGGQ